MEIKVLPKEVADAFVKQYYVILNKCPENVYKFYQEASVLGWPGPDGIVTPTTTLSEINDKIMSSDHKSCSMDIQTVDAQDSLEGGIIIAVTGSFVHNDNVTKNFLQTFFLAKQETGFFVLNDILRFFDTCLPITSAANDDAVNDQSVNPSLKITDAKAVVENGNTKDTVSYGAKSVDAPNSEDRVSNGAKAIDTSNSKDPVSNGATSRSTSSTTAYEKVYSGKKSVVHAPATNVAPKITYASMVTKETPASVPITAGVASDVKKQTVNSRPTKVSASLGDSAAKSPIYGNIISKESASSSTIVPKLLTSSNGATNMIASGESRGIYIGRLPYDITKQAIIDVVKQFGSVKRNSDPVQIRRHEDGFCCGFVEFESADSARRAVEAHHVKFGDKESYITYKRSYPNRGSDGEGRSPTRGRSQNSSYYNRGQESETTGKARFQNENRSDHIEVQAWGGSRQRRPADQWASHR